MELHGVGELQQALQEIHPAGSGARDSMLVAGGYTAAPSTLVDSYDGSSFSTETAMPTASYGQSLAASAYDSAHITGGYSTLSLYWNL